MSAQEIMAELPKLTPEELRQVQHKIEELIPRENVDAESVWDVFERFAGTAKGLPADMAANHDHYLYGTPKKS